MKLRIVNGRPQRPAATSSGPSAPPPVTDQIEVYECSECDRVYKTELGRDNHLLANH